MNQRESDRDDVSVLVERETNVVEDCSTKTIIFCQASIVRRKQLYFVKPRKSK